LALSSLKDSDWVTRLNGLKALATLDGKGAIPHLLPLLNDSNPRVQAEAKKKKTLQQLGYRIGE
jgi:HEAT repeat protein